MTATLPQQRPSAPAPAPHRAPRRELRKSLILAVGVVVSVLVLLTAVTIGTAGVGLGDVIHSLRVSLLGGRSEEHTSELQSRGHLVCRLLLEKKKQTHKS